MSGARTTIWPVPRRRYRKFNTIFAFSPSRRQFVLDRQTGRSVPHEPGDVPERWLRPEVQRDAAEKITETALVVRMRRAQTIPLRRVSQGVYSKILAEIAHDPDSRSAVGLLSDIRRPPLPPRPHTHPYPPVTVASTLHVQFRFFFHLFVI